MPIVRHGYAKRKNKDSAARAKSRNAILAHATYCAICGQRATKSDPFEADHIVPVSDGGSDDVSNLRAVHRSCNRKRGVG
jgi:5-methylcytosine-specific restriction endonuclease McrA